MPANWRVSVTTLNCAKSFPFDDEDAISKIIKQLLPERMSHDIYVVGFQELVSIWEASFPNIVESVMKSIGYLILKYINTQARERRYCLAGSTSTGAVGVLVYIDQNFVKEKITYSNYKCGLFNSSLKGAAAVCCSLRRNDEEQETFTFICSHLNANEGIQNAELRVDNYKSIMSACAADLRLTPFKETHVFFFGDLNFRADGWHDTQADYFRQDVIREILEDNEELNKLREQYVAFQGFDEPLITFPPTYKYITSKQNELNPNRKPSWCDRILFKKYLKGTFNTHSYKSIHRTPELQFTDHQAVVLDIEVPAIPSGPSLTIPTVVLSSQQKLVGDIADMLIGYMGYLISKRVHYWVLVGVSLLLLYKIL